ncbi:hypothetical protein [Mesorhizobium sp. AA23]|uniref:hypothetical protein n=1 Tax=Mesorhizobium sp. AA23 TaxID=1854058 RepID=UPI0012EA22D9|nr:hypothetical protein [Mesorhizobium sp. AA23]
MLFKAALAFVASLVSTLASANDEGLQFQIEIELAYLKVGYGIESVEVAPTVFELKSSSA